MSNDGLIIENMDMSHIHLAVKLFPYTDFIIGKGVSDFKSLSGLLWGYGKKLWKFEFSFSNMKKKSCSQFNNFQSKNTSTILRKKAVLQNYMQNPTELGGKDTEQYRISIEHRKPKCLGQKLQNRGFLNHSC
jgi:hypothetical protein